MPRKFADAPLSVAHLSEIDLAPLDLLSATQQAGGTSVGVRLAPVAPGGVAYPLATKTEQADLRRAIDATGVSVLSIEFISLGGKTRPLEYRAMMEAGAAIGATRIGISGESADIALMTDKFAELCEAAHPFGLAIDLEFMPFRAVKDLAMAVSIVQAANQPNGHLLIDALHVFRSNSSLDVLRSLDRRWLGVLQLCDAAAVAPSAEDLILEARTRRLAPGRGGLNLRALLDALPEDIPISLEAPMAAAYPTLSPAERLVQLISTTRTCLSEIP